MMTVYMIGRFEAAHRLPNVPEGHKCARLHGHNWTVKITCGGNVNAHTGFLIDFFEVDRAWRQKVHAVLDHQLLNDIVGLENPTSENLAMWIWETLAPWLPLTQIEVKETDDLGCVFEGHQSGPAAD
jgi:6-pyruvoyltetrahydropterin/6-carboxytetrahydropterin synthase